MNNPGYQHILSRTQPDAIQRSTPVTKETADLGTTFKTDMYTYFTQATGQTTLVFSAETWVKIRLLLETAGPVSIGWRENLGPVLSGQGRLLPTGLEVWFAMPPGQRLYFASNTVDRVSVVVERIPFGQQILHQIGEVPGAIAAALAGLFRDRKVAR
jgi:hypothetical protein